MSLYELCSDVLLCVEINDFLYELSNVAFRGMMSPWVPKNRAVQGAWKDYGMWGFLHLKMFLDKGQIQCWTSVNWLTWLTMTGYSVLIGLTLHYTVFSCFTICLLHCHIFTPVNVYTSKVIPFPSRKQTDYFSVCVEDYSFIMQQIDGAACKRKGKGNQICVCDRQFIR